MMNSSDDPGGHSNTERGYLSVLASKLRSELGSQASGEEGLADVEVVVSEKDKDPLQIV